MVGIVIVSHSGKIAEGARELALQMAPEAPIAAAGGLPDGGIGTDFERIYQGVEGVFGPDGVVILFDLGSARMTAEMVVDLFPEGKVRLADGPVVESTVVAAVGSAGGNSLEGILAEIAEAKGISKLNE